jgi:predicted RecA/RadA family phage recombinase
MVEVKTVEYVESTKTEDPGAWVKATPRPAVAVRHCPAGATVDGVAIQPGHFAVHLADESVVGLPPDIVRAFLDVP